MKRCNNCGWTNNPDSNTHCEKCNSPLTDNQGVSSAPSGGNAGASGEFINGTVMEMGGGAVGGNAHAHFKKTNRKAGVDEETFQETGVCPSCGYPLRSGCRECPQCHTAVNGAGGNKHKNKTSRMNGMDDNLGDSRDYKENDSAERSKHHTSVRPCPKCGYDNRNDAQFCSNCGTPLVEQKCVCAACGHEMNPSDKFCPACGHSKTGAKPNGAGKPKGKNAFKGTVSPSQYKPSTITLTAINPFNDAKFEPLQLSFDDDETILNRENLEANNPTISRNQQAVLSLEDGQWFLENKSNGMTTALVLTEKHEIKAGDIILIGNRVFEVSVS